MKANAAKKDFIIFPLCFFVIFFILYKLQWIGYPSFQAPFIQTADYCLGYLASGTLYGGQPYCFQGPVVYITAAVLQFIFGQLERGLIFSYCISIFLVAGVIFLIVFHETAKKRFFLVSFIIIFVFGKIFVQDFATVVALVLVLAGFYVFQYMNFQGKYAIAGLLFSLSLFSKPHNTPFVIGPLLFFWLYKGYKEKAIKEKIKPLIALSLPFFVLLGIFVLVFPNFIMYNYVIHTYNPTVQSISSILWELVIFKYYYNGLFLLLYIAVWIAALRCFFYKRFDVFSFISSISFLVLVIVVANKFTLYQLIDQYRYFSMFVPFFLVEMFMFGEEITKNPGKKVVLLFSISIVGIGCILWLLLSGLTMNDFIMNKGINEQKVLDRIKLELEMPLLSIPQQSGKIFVSENYLERYKLLFEDNPFKYIIKDDIVNYWLESYDSSHDPDLAVANNFIKIGMLRAEELNGYFNITSININDSQHMSSINSREYTLILVKPIDEVIIRRVMEENLKMGFKPTYCSINVPFYHEGFNNSEYFYIVLLFYDPEQCALFLEEMKEYYTNAFDALCERGEPFVEIVESSLLYKNIQMEKTCNSASKLFLLNSGLRISALFFIILIWLYLVCILTKVLVLMSQEMFKKTK
jgi:hypothetical protein